VRAVLSDLDGVLVDSRASVLRAWRDWASRHGVDRRLLEGDLHGRPSIEVITAAAPQLDAAAESAAIEEVQARDIDGVVALPGAHELFQTFANGDLAVVTSCTVSLAHARLSAAGLPEPGVLITPERVERGKPAPDAYLLAAAELGVDPRDCVVLEDAPAGAAAGRAAGARVVGILTTYGVEGLPADEHAASVADWLEREH
jgi:mannitol-1-/sugar-/sorbitol-6-phosphatase